MNTSPRKDIELPRVKRKYDSWDGKSIEYLLNHPSKKLASELLMEAVTSYWLVEALAGKVSEEELNIACLSSIGQLEGKLIKIRTLMQRVFNSATPVSDNSGTSSRTEVTENQLFLLNQVSPSGKEVAQKEKSSNGEQQASEVEAEDENLGLLDIKLTDDLRIATQLLGFEESNGNKSL